MSAFLGLALALQTRALAALPPEDQVVMNPKKGYLHVIWMAPADAQARAGIEAILNGPALQKHPDLPWFKADAVQILPNGQGFKTLGRFEAQKGSGAVQLTKAEGPSEGLALDADDLLITSKQGIVQVLWDSYPYRALLQGKDKDALIEKVVTQILKGPAKKKFPDLPQFKVDVVEFKDRDNYGAPRRDSVKVVARYEAKADPASKELTLKKTK